MDANTVLVEQLKSLLEREPLLEQELDNTNSVEQAVRLALDAAMRHGITLDVVALTSLLRSPAPEPRGEIPDERLAGVDGGYPKDWTLQQRLAHERKRSF